MDNSQPTTVSRKEIGIRFAYSVIFLIIFEVLKLLIQLIVLFQFAYLFITKQYSHPMRAFSNKIAVYTYKVMRYLSLCENLRPFPFNNLPTEIEAAEDPVRFDDGREI